MTPNDSAMEYVRWYIESISRTCEKQNLKKWSYSIWAANEILERLESNLDIPPLVILEEIRDDMETYSKMNAFSDYVFSCGKDTTERIIDMLIS